VRPRTRSTRTGISSPPAGEEGPCGWLKDRYGLSWQIVPRALSELLGDPDLEKSQRVMWAMLKMKKLAIDALEQAAGAGVGRQVARAYQMPGTRRARPRA
jgi:hypothetical protein